MGQCNGNILGVKGNIFREFSSLSWKDMGSNPIGCSCTEFLSFHRTMKAFYHSPRKVIIFMIDLLLLLFLIILFEHTFSALRGAGYKTDICP